jgi:uncharacterized protein
MSSPHKAPNQPPASGEHARPSTPSEIPPHSEPILVPPESLPPQEPLAAEQAPEQAAAPATPGPTALSEDLRVPWRWRDIFAFAAFYIGSTWLLAVVLLSVVAGLRHISPRALLDDKQALVNISLIAQTITSALSLAFFWILIRARSSAPFWWRLGWRPLPQASGKHSRVGLFVLSGVGLAVLAALLDSWLPQKQELPIQKMLETSESMVLFAIFGILIAPFIEESVFRGFLYPVVARSAGIGPGIVITGLIFGLFHAAQLWGGWAQIAVIMILGIVLTWVRARQQSVLASFLIHLSYNTAITLFGLVGTIGLRHGK